MTHEPNWFAGIDWASRAHRACVLDAAGKIVGERAFAHGGAGLAELCDWLTAATGAAPAAIAVAIETSHGPVVETVLERGFAVFALNPKQLDRFRDRFTVAGAKDDRRDAHVLADSVRTDRQCFRRLAVADPRVVELRAHSRLAEELQADRTRLANRLREELWRYYPQALEITDDPGADWFLALWTLAPTPDKARRVREASIARLLAEHRVRRIGAAEVVRRLRQTPLAVAEGATQAAQAHIQSLVPRLKLLNRQIRATHRRLEALCAQLDGTKEGDPPGQPGEQRDATILKSLPGVGRIVLATLLSEAPEPLRRRDYHALRALSGVAPVTRQSGKHRLVIRRQACHHRLRDAVYHWARVAIQHDPISRQRYAALRNRGHSHARALRTVADRLLKLACVMLAGQAEFDPDHRTPRTATPVPAG